MKVHVLRQVAADLTGLQREQAREHEGVSEQPAKSVGRRDSGSRNRRLLAKILPVFHASASAHQPWVGLDQSSRESHPALLPTRSRSSLSVADNVWRGKSDSKR